MQFETKIWHPNICSKTGTICLDVLKKDWKSTVTIKTILLYVQALLYCPEPDQPQDVAAAKQ